MDKFASFLAADDIRQLDKGQLALFKQLNQRRRRQLQQLRANKAAGGLAREVADFEKRLMGKLRVAALVELEVLTDELLSN